jgi:hypothetical protein
MGLKIPKDLQEEYDHLIKMRTLWEADKEWGWTAEINCPTKRYIDLIERIALLEENIEIVIDNMPPESVVRIREGGAFEDLSATLAVSVAKLSSLWETR